jgi:hypothetical protein
MPTCTTMHTLQLGAVGAACVPGHTLCAPPPAAAAHSLRADIVISRHMMMTTGTVIASWLIGWGGLVVRRMRVVATLGDAQASTRPRLRWIDRVPMQAEQYGHAARGLQQLRLAPAYYAQAPQHFMHSWLCTAHRGVCAHARGCECVASSCWAQFWRCIYAAKLQALYAHKLISHWVQEGSKCCGQLELKQ